MCASLPSVAQHTIPVFKGDFDLQGHRGCRGLRPENTLPAFKYAVELGVTTLELDVVISADNKVVVSHEPWISDDICLQVDEKLPFRQVIGQLTYAQISAFDCGSKRHNRFPEQVNSVASKPLLSKVLTEIRAFADSLDREIRFSIEIKSKPKWDGLEQPGPQTAVPLVLNVISASGEFSNSSIQSFDYRVLRLVREVYPEMKLVCLVEAHNLPFRRSYYREIESLGFKPDVYSPNALFVSKKLVKRVQADGLKLVPWTVNKPERMSKLLRWGVDGLITDYPDRAINLSSVLLNTE
ncbi:MAG: glycerophosphoryl diester phosphodiesterase [Limisphaerales bacterium]|jgi:glycerophosphoryl diester phosphodiesterase